MSVARTLRAALVSAAVVLAVVACTSDDADQPTPDASVTDEEGEEPEEAGPPVGIRMAVVLPPSDAVDSAVLSAMASDVRRLDAMRPQEVAEIRYYRPTGSDFVGDMAWALAEQDVDLICLLGRGSRGTVNELASVYPQLRFCATPLAASLESADAVSILEVRFEELGYVIGLAAAQASGGDPVGVVLGSEASPRVSFRDGLLNGLGRTESVVVTVDGDLDASEAVAGLEERGVEVVVIDAVRGASDAAELAASFATVIGPDVVLSADAVGDSASMTWRVGWEQVLRIELARLLRDDADEDPASLGFAEEVFRIAHGPASTTQSRLLVAQAIGELTAGAVDPLGDPPEPPEEDAEDEDDEADDGEDADDDAGDDDAGDDDADDGAGDDG